MCLLWRRREARCPSALYACSASHIKLREQSGADLFPAGQEDHFHLTNMRTECTLNMTRVRSNDGEGKSAASPPNSIVDRNRSYLTPQHVCLVPTRGSARGKFCQLSYVAVAVDTFTLHRLHTRSIL